MRNDLIHGKYTSRERVFAGVSVMKIKRKNVLDSVAFPGTICHTRIRDFTLEHRAHRAKYSWDEEKDKPNRFQRIRRIIIMNAVIVSEKFLSSNFQIVTVTMLCVVLNVPMHMCSFGVGSGSSHARRNQRDSKMSIYMATKAFRQLHAVVSYLLCMKMKNLYTIFLFYIIIIIIMWVSEWVSVLQMRQLEMNAGT